VNAIYKFLEKERIQREELTLLKGAIEIVIILLFPFVPHLTEELWEIIGKNPDHLATFWPEYDEKYIIEDKVMIAVQINGKLRDTCEVDRGIDEAQLKEIVFALDKIKKHTEGKEIKKTIMVPNKLVNIVCV
ncbi:MAG: class I tRNA ligase family protein, partial [Deltaproteobacteria bacterium]